MADKSEGTRGPEPRAGRYAYDGLQRIFHEKARLGIMASLMASSTGLLFTELKELCSLTDGNLSRHMQVLSEAGFVEVFKGFERRKPQTLYRVSARGRERLLAYLEELERVVNDMASAATCTRAGASDQSELPRGWIPV